MTMVYKVKYELRIFTFLTILLVGGLLSGGILMASDNACAATDENIFYSYSVSFTFNGESGEHIEWDFGDETPKVLDKWINVEHTYEIIGTYTVKQTVTNSVGDSDTAEIVIHIEGHPIVTFITGDEDFVSSVEVPYIDSKAQALPESVGVPKIAGKTFEGWYYDEAFTQKWTSEDEIIHHETLYANLIDEESGFSTLYLILISIITFLIIVILILIIATRRRKEIEE